MTHDTPTTLRSRLDALAQTAPGDAGEFWFARDLLKTLRYAGPGNFMIPIRRAEASCGEAGPTGTPHFQGVSRLMPAGEGGAIRVRDVRLSRYACHLLAMNGDPRKAPIAFAREYFASPKSAQEPGSVSPAPIPAAAAATPKTQALVGSNNPWAAALQRIQSGKNGGTRFVPTPGGHAQGQPSPIGNPRVNRNLAVGRGHPNGAARTSK